MKTEIREVYKCEYCNKMYQRKRFALEHEKICSKNPENKRACLDGCIHLTKKKVEVKDRIDDYYTGEIEYVIRTLFYCDKKKIFLYPPECEYKDNYYTNFYNEEDENKPMPKECDEYESH
jgi:hypothetical protein